MLIFKKEKEVRKLVLSHLATVQDCLVETRNVLEQYMAGNAEATVEKAKLVNEIESQADTFEREIREALLELRRLYDEVGEKYKALAADPAVVQAVAQYNQAHSANHRLGPTSGLARLGGKLERLEQTVLSGAIDLRRGPGGLWHVTVMFNSKFPQEMAIDTGASVIALPWDTAVDVGLTPDSDDPKILVQVADGRLVEARRVVAETVRVGKFTAKDVECSVMPPGLSGSTPLLGLSFLRNFDFRIDSGKGQLVMSQLDASDGDERSGATASRRARK